MSLASPLLAAMVGTEAVTCIVCSSAPARRNWRCETCSKHLQRKGADRPPELLDRALEREMTRTR